MSDVESDSAALTRTRSLYAGCGFWVVFSLVAVLVRGVRWDETYEHALAITRIAPYPLDHPFYIYTRNIYSFQSYLSAGILWITGSALAVCLFRDVMQLMFMTVPLYLFAVVVCRRAIWGHVAVVLGLLNVYVFFESHYAMETWPGFFSVGQLGAGYALLVFAAFLGGWTRTAWFLLMLLLAVHVGQLPPLLLFAAVWLVWGDGAHRKKEFRAALIWGGAGFALSVAFLLIQRSFVVPYPTEGAYFAEGDAAQIWIDYSSRQDVHRFIEYIHPFRYSAVLAGLVMILAGLGVGSDATERTPRSVHGSILFYALFVGVISIGVRCVQLLMGDDIPFLLIGWMPYRIPNHLAPILLCMTLGVVAKGVSGDGARRYSGYLWAIVVLAMALPIALGGRLIPGGIYHGYIEGGEYICFVLIGGALGVFSERLRIESRLGYFSGAVICVAALIVFGLTNYYVLACVLAGIGLHWGFRGVSMRPRVLARWSTALAGVVVAFILVREWTSREHLPRTAFQEGVVAYLAEAGESDVTIIPPIWEVEWGARTGAPIFIDYQTPRLITYISALGPSLKKMHQDVYGQSIDGSSEEGLLSWPEISRGRWTELGEDYSFGYLVHPTDLPLHLDAVYSHDGMSLYRIPVGE